MALPITTALSGFLALILLALAAAVLKVRRSSENKHLERRMRGQANFIEYVPVTLILFALLELQNVNVTFLTIMAIAFAFARTIHGYAFGFTEYWSFGRFYGTLITFSVILILGVTALYIGFTG